MSKFSNILKMIILLKSYGKMTAKELAKELEVSERMIRKYKDDLEMSGVYVESIKGLNGGYVLTGWDYLLKLDVTKEEYEALLTGYEQLKGCNFVYLEEYKALLNKINITNNNVGFNYNKYYLAKDFPGIDINDEKKKCVDINSAIITKKKVNIKYFSLSSGESERIVDPYALISYKGSMYFVAYCEKTAAIKEFKVHRIKSYFITNDKFEIIKEFNLNNYMEKSFGLYKDEKISVKLRIIKPMSYIVSEKKWVIDQNITWNKDESIIFQAEMEGKTEILSWVLSMGGMVEVLEPLSLKKELKQEIEKMMQKLI